MTNLAFFLSGIATGTFGASSLFFFKFWRASRDRFFLLFAFACALISLERVVLLILHGTWDPIRSSVTELNAWVYCMRLLAFIFIVLAIIDKNRKEKLR